MSLELSNLRTIQDGEWTKLIVDVSHEGIKMDIPQNFWFALKNENAGMFANDVYDAFIIVPMYIAMYYKTDLRIHGFVSKRLFKNLTTYFQKIICNFSKSFSPCKIVVDGFRDAKINLGGVILSAQVCHAGLIRSLRFTIDI